MKQPYREQPIDVVTITSSWKTQVSRKVRNYFEDRGVKLKLGDELVFYALENGEVAVRRNDRPSRTRG